MNGDKGQGRVAVFAILAALAAICSAGVSVISVSIQVGLISPIPPRPTATPNLTPFTQGPTCGKNGTLDPNLAWQDDGSKTTSYKCVAAGFVVTQAPNAEFTGTVWLPIPQPHYQVVRDYGISVEISGFAHPHGCGGIYFRSTGLRSYEVEICRDGVWAIAKTFGTNGIPEYLQIGAFSVNTSGSYQLDVEVSHDTLSGEFDFQNLPAVNLDPTFQDGYIGLFVDDCNPKFSQDCNLGASATFGKFIFTPLI